VAEDYEHDVEPLHERGYSEGNREKKYEEVKFLRIKEIIN
jgi:hypothetical protein